MSDDLLASLWFEADSTVPSDELTPSLGSRFLLDGFDFDQEDNEGVLDHARLPQVRGLSGLPDGLIQTASDPFSVVLGDNAFTLEDEDGMDLTALMRDASLPNLDWLDPTQLQDLDRLPVNPVDLAIPELEEAWGQDLDTDGLGIVPNIDLEVAQYQQSIQEGPQSDLPGSPEDFRNAHQKTAQLQRIVRVAIRQSHEGRPLDSILRHAALELGPAASDAKPLMQAIARRHGLTGNVLVQAVAFPGLLQGKWDRFIKKHAKGARYILATPGSKVAAVDNYLGKKIVTEIPWKKALAHYTPRLEASGRKVASSRDPRAALRRAFRSKARRASPAPTGHKPVDVRPADRVSTTEAWEELSQAQRTERDVLGKAPDTKQAALVAKQLEQWRKAGLLTDDAVTDLTISGKDPRAILKAGAAMIAAQHSLKKYHGTGVGLLVPKDDVSVAEAYRELRAAEDPQERQTREFEASQRSKAVKAINRMATTGLLSKKDAARILALDKSANELLEAASVVARTPRKMAVPKSEPAREFQGPVLERAPTKQSGSLKDFSPQQLRVIAAAKESGIASGEFRTLLRTVRKAMSEGVAGQPLDEYLRVRFSSPLLVAASHLIHDIRQTHEGLSGHLYVDAEAYATKKGVKGCEKGGDRHRVNPIKFVMAMDRCGTCVHRNVNDHCAKYKKLLFSSLPVEDAAVYQAEMIRLANGGDAAIIAAMFDPKEFGLCNSPLEEVIVGDHGATPEALGEILFGGIEL